MESYSEWSATKLRDFLLVRGISCTGYSKEHLVKIVECAASLNLDCDPDYNNDESSVPSKLSKIGLPLDTNPLEMSGYSANFNEVPDFGLIDIFNYLICSKCDYDGKKLKAYKSYDDYRLFEDGHVDDLLFNPLTEMNSDFCLFKAYVKPTQRGLTYLKKPYYELWIAMDKLNGIVITAHCECKGGADGACRHVSATMYEIENFDKKSCTDGENLWKKRDTQKCIPTKIRNTVIKRPNSFQNNLKPYADVFDPRPKHLRSSYPAEGERALGCELQNISSNCQVLDVLLDPMDFVPESEPLLASPDLQKKSISNKIIDYISSNEAVEFDHFMSHISYSNDDVSEILCGTKGQSANPNWFNMRKGLLTASYFDKATKLEKKNKLSPPSFLKSICLEYGDVDSNSLSWGKRKEPIARDLYQKMNKNYHVCYRIEEVGLRIFSESPIIGCSADGVVTCKCRKQHNPRLIEIKCPWQFRDQHPKIVARDEKHCIFNNNTNRWEVTPNCPYYCQIQGQLGIYGYSECDLIIYTKQGIHISTAVFDEEFFNNMIENLISFYKKNIFPYIVDKYKL